MKGLLVRVLLKCRAKEDGDEESVRRIWKEHYVDFSPMYKKIDVITRQIGISFIPQWAMDVGSLWVSMQTMKMDESRDLQVLGP